MNEFWLAAKDLKDELDCSEMTIYRYIERHRRFLKVQKRGGVLMVSSDSLPLMRKIRYFYEKGWNRQRVEGALEATEPLNMVVHDEQQQVNRTLDGYLGDLQKILHAMAERQENLETEILDLKEQLRKRDQDLQRFIAEENQGIQDSLSRVEKYANRRRGLLRWLQRDN